MAAQDYPVFEITATFPNARQRTGRFEFKKATVESGIRTGYLVENKLSDVLGTLGNLAGEGNRKGITVDTGGGQHYNEVDMSSLSAEDGQWGYSTDPTVLDEATATGGDRIQKKQIFNHYLIRASPDSFTPARLEYGEWAPNGVMPQDHIPVYIEDPSFRIPKDESSSMTGNLRFISTIDLSIRTPTATERTG